MAIELGGRHEGAESATPLRFERPRVIGGILRGMTGGKGHAQLKRRVARDKRPIVPIAIWFVLSAFTAVIMWVGSADQLGIGPGATISPTSGYHVEIPTQASPGYFGTVANWDGQWYATIALHGYPTELPMRDGSVRQNPWAFSPAYPILVRAMMEVSGLNFPIAAWLVSILFSATMAVAVYRLAARYLETFGSAALVACLYAYPAAVVFQAAYAEGLALLLIVLSLSGLLQRRYPWVFVSTLVLAFTRPVLLPFALIVVLHYWHRRKSHKLGEREFTRAERWWLMALGLWCIAMAFAWQAVAAFVTGRVDAVTASLAAWPAYENGVFGGWTRSVMEPSPEGIGAFAVLAALLWLGMRKESRLWPLELRTWPIAYSLYIFAATRPHFSIVRYAVLSLLPLWPFPELSARRESGSRGYWIVAPALVLLGMLLQILFIRQIWIVHSPANPGPP